MTKAPALPSRILFLDIDGVLVNRAVLKCVMEDGRHAFDPKAVELLNDIVTVKDCDIVISSSWRCGDTAWIRAIFEARGFAYSHRIIGETMHGYSSLRPGEKFEFLRGLEIYNWLKQNATRDAQYAILDDDSDMLLWQKDHFVQTKTEVGLTRAEFDKVCWIFDN